MYNFFRRFLFCLPSESAHNFTLRILAYLPKFLFTHPNKSPVTFMGLQFEHRLGLAAGFDVNGRYIDALAKVGFSFIEIGTVTPRPQFGNPRPRIFRLPTVNALINRMGFNNDGVDNLLMNLRKSKHQGIIGVNIGKNKDTPILSAINDYIYCLRKVYNYAAYITINISSPNTAELRKLQQSDYLQNFISAITKEREKLAQKWQRMVPIALKISPDESLSTLENIAKVVLANGVDAIIATNTTCSRDDLLGIKYGDEKGGLSGRPLFEKSTNTLRILKNIVGDKVVLIGVGGIEDTASANEKLASGADLLQVYTGLIYQGPRIINVYDSKSGLCEKPAK